MGWSYHHVIVKGPFQAEITVFLRRIHTPAYVSPTVAGFTTIYGSFRGGQELSEHFNCPALEIGVADSDMLWYQLYNTGLLVDTYRSDPEYPIHIGEIDRTSIRYTDYGWPIPSGGDAENLCATFDVRCAAMNVEAVLRHMPSRTKDGYIGRWEPQERHERLMMALRFPVFTESLIYWAIDRSSALIFDGDLADAGDPSDYTLAESQ